MAQKKPLDNTRGFFFSALRPLIRGYGLGGSPPRFIGVLPAQMEQRLQPTSLPNLTLTFTLPLPFPINGEGNPPSPGGSALEGGGLQVSVEWHM